MEAGGNDKLNSFFATYGVVKETDIVAKYNSNAASVYRDRVCALADGRHWRDPPVVKESSVGSKKPPIASVSKDNWDSFEEKSGGDVRRSGSVGEFGRGGGRGGSVVKIRVPIPNIRHLVHFMSQGPVTNSLFSSVFSSPVLLSIYNSAELSKARPTAYTHDLLIPSSSSDDELYKWHLPEPNAIDIFGNSDCSLAKSRTIVVLLGWLGAKQKHLRKYAEYYITRGFNVITFTFPMSQIVSYKAGGKAEEHVDLLVNHLSDCLEEELGKNLVFHTFSNTGWLTYGVILEKFQQMGYTLRERIKGCIIDSAPVSSPDPQVNSSCTSLFEY